MSAMKKLLPCILGFSAIIGTISCGGDGEVKTFTKTALIVQNVERLNSLCAAESGASPATANQTGALPSIGAFVRHFGGPAGIGPAMLLHTLKPGQVAETVGGEDFYYYDHLQLWVETQWSGKVFASKLFQDQSKTKPAGAVTTTFTGPTNVFPQTYTADYKLAAGPLAGAKGSYTCTLSSLLRGSLVFSETFADGAHDRGSSHWSETNSNWQMKWEGPAKTGTYKANGAWAADGSGTSEIASSDGFTSTWKYKSDGSGTAHLAGTDPKLPAELAWTPVGAITATYSDSIKENWGRDDIWTQATGDGASALMNLITAPSETAAPTTVPDPKDSKDSKDADKK